MPEYPDLEAYRAALAERIEGARLERLSLAAPHLLASVEPPPDALAGRGVVRVRRVAKQLVILLEGAHFCSVHLAVAGRLHWSGAGPEGKTGGKTGGKPGGKTGGKPARLSPRGNLAIWDFETADGGAGQLRLLERSRKKRATIRLGATEAALAALDPGGLEVPGSTLGDFAARLADCPRTLKRALTEPARFAGIGNAYSDEILWRARLSPTKRANRLDAGETARLHRAAAGVLAEWAARLRAGPGAAFPAGVTAFRPEMAVHGKFGQPCPECGSPVQRIARAENECNYCPACQTGGRLLRDRALSRLLKKTWPKTVAEAEHRRRALGGAAPSSSAPRRGAPGSPRRRPGGREPAG